MSTSVERITVDFNNLTDTSPLIMFAGGGTGGHLMPALATAEVLRRKVPECGCIFLVSPRVMNTFRRKLEDYRVFLLPELRWLTPASAPGLVFKSIISLGKTFDIFFKLRPDAVIGMGGLACAPAIFASWLMRRPSMLFEANAVPGKAVRLLRPLCSAVQCSWPDEKHSRGSDKQLCFGTPVHPDLLDGDRNEAAKKYSLDPHICTMLLTGGTQGALALNKLLLKALKKLGEKKVKLQILHITGPDHIKAFTGIKTPGNITYRPVGFEPNMKDAYWASDFAVCRAGGGTIAELTALGIPSILVPFPHATDGHQLQNARRIADHKAAFLIKQKELTDTILADIIIKMTYDKKLRNDMKIRAEAIAHRNAASSAADAILQLCATSVALRAQRQSIKESSAYLKYFLNYNHLRLKGGCENGRNKISEQV